MIFGDAMLGGTDTSQYLASFGEGIFPIIYFVYPNLDLPFGKLSSSRRELRSQFFKALVRLIGPILQRTEKIGQKCFFLHIVLLWLV